MSCTRTTQKELRALILRLDAELNDFGGTEEDKREALEDLALVARDVMDEDNARGDLSITHNETGSITIAAIRDGDFREDITGPGFTLRWFEEDESLY